MLSVPRSSARYVGVVLATFGVGMAGAIGAAPSASALPCQLCGPGHLPSPPPAPPRQPQPPPPPAITPALSIDMARQTPDRGSVHVVGWTAQSNAPTTPLTVQISLDGASPTSLTANVARSDVAAAYPADGPNHGFDVVIPASQSPKQVCVTVLAAPGGDNRTSCTGTNDVTGFNATGITYDTAHTQTTSSTLDELDSVTSTNATKVQQSTTISGQKTLTDASSWTDTYGVQVNVSAGISVPIFASFTVSVQGSATFAQNGTTTTQTQFTWSQPVLVPPQSKVVMDAAAYRTTLVVPYTMTGNAVYQDGTTTPYSINGTYSGVSSHDLQVTLTQYNLNGTPAAAPAAQASPHYLRSQTS
jgi:hypothetical protein